MTRGNVRQLDGMRVADDPRRRCNMHDLAALNPLGPIGVIAAAAGISVGVKPPTRLAAAA